MKSLLQDFGDYQIVEKLGRGGMADVYLAVNRKSNRRVALKLVEHGEGAEAQEILEAERLGAGLQQRLSRLDERIPQIHAFGDLLDCFFIEMEFVEGTDLSMLIGTGTLKPENAAGIAMELCDILRHAHSLSLQVEGRELRAIVHGDIKPKNIRIDTGGRVRVLDFGIAKGLSITRRLTSNVFGSIAYSSPERLESGRIDEMSDLWSVGIVLYEMLEGRLPFEATSEERLELVIRSRTAPRPFLEPCPPVLQQIVCKALARSPESRYRSAAEFESDLEAFLSGRQTQAAQEDEQTRRTVPAESVETRRNIGEEQPIAAPPGSPVPAKQSPGGVWFRRLSSRKKQIGIGTVILIAALGIWEGVSVRGAFRLRSDFVQRRLDGDSAWKRYEEIRSPFGIASLTVRGSLLNLLQEDCERMCSEYRSTDTTSVWEKDWMRCKRYMAHAIQLKPSDKKSKAMLEYANGHILRINRKSTDAVAAFQLASTLQPNWPDPYLGMARTYINNLNDVDRGTQALERAQRLGYSFGKRELAMMAEAFRARGLQAQDNANLVKGTNREKELLQKARESYNEALKMYLKITPYGNSTALIKSVQDSLAVIEQRLELLNEPNPLLPWNWLK